MRASSSQTALRHFLFQCATWVSVDFIILYILLVCQYNLFDQTICVNFDVMRYNFEAYALPWTIWNPSTINLANAERKILQYMDSDFTDSLVFLGITDRRFLRWVEIVVQASVLRLPQNRGDINGALLETRVSWCNCRDLQHKRCCVLLK